MTTAPTQVNLSVFPQQAEFVDCQCAYPAFIGGIGSGKSEGGAIKLLLYLSEHPGALFMVTAPTFPMLRDATLRSVFKVFPEGSYTFNRGDMHLRYLNGSEALFRPSMDNPEHLRGPNLAGAWMDEPAQGTITNPDAQYDAYLILQGRLRQPEHPHQLWVTGTPQGYNWLWREFAREPREGYHLVTCSARDNPFLTPDFIRRLEESYRGEFALQEIEGRFVVVGGRMFFDREAVEDMQADCEEPREVSSGGLVRVWKRPVVGRKYVAGADTAWGTSGSRSVAAVFDWQTMEQVADIYGRPHPDEMAQLLVKLCRSYNDAYLVAEYAGEGQERSDTQSVVVVDKLVELGYGGRMYHRGADWATNRKHRGWWTDAYTRPVLLGELEEAVRLRAVRLKAREGVDEFMSFIRNEKGRPEPSQGAYGDYVMAAGMAWQARTWARFSAVGHRAAVAPRGW